MTKLIKGLVDSIKVFGGIFREKAKPQPNRQWFGNRILKPPEQK